MDRLADWLADPFAVVALLLAVLVTGLVLLVLWDTWQSGRAPRIRRHRRRPPP